MSLTEDILAARYYKHGETSRDQVFRRVADFIGNTADEKDHYYAMMHNNEFLPNSPTLMNAGAVEQPFMSACVVLPIEDDMESIFNSVRNAAVCHQRGAGCIAEGSLVFTKNGIVQIEDVQVGDEVWSLNAKTGKQSYCKVTETHIYGIFDKKIVRVSFAGENNYTITSDYHPFTVLTADGRYIFVKASELKQGDNVVYGSTVKPSSIKFNVRGYNKGVSTNTYPETVPEHYTDSYILSYLAGMLQGATYTLSHGFKGSFVSYVKKYAPEAGDTFASVIYTTNNGKILDLVASLLSKEGVLFSYNKNEERYEITVQIQYATAGHKLLAFMHKDITYPLGITEIQDHTLKVVSVTEDTCNALRDLTVEKNNTYFAGTSGALCFIHNTGFSFDRLRCEGSLVKSSEGKASGPVSFLQVFDKATSVVSQGGSRRGANMGIISVGHPDIMKFITCKQKEGDIKNFNLSIMITDEFMNAVLAGDFSKVMSKTHDGKENTVGDIWRAITENTWNNGEPGVLFYNTINNDSTVKHLGNIESTNPCFTGDACLLTKHGYFPFKSLVGEKVEVWNGLFWSTTVPRLMGKDQDVYLVTFDNGLSVKATANHRWITYDGIKETSELVPEQTCIRTCRMPSLVGSLFLYDAYKYGYFCGAGFKYKGQNFINVSRDQLQQFSINQTNSSQYVGTETFRVHVDDTWCLSYIPSVVYSLQSRRAWFSGLCDACGKTDKKGNVVISHTNKKYLTELVYFLNLQAGAGKIEKAGEYTYTLTVPKRFVNSMFINKYTKTLGITNVPSEPQKKMSDPHKPYVVSVTLCGKEDVYCCVEKYLHRIVVNGLWTGNCGEQPLLPYESCTLGSINISKYILPEAYNPDKPYDDLKACVDLEKFENDVSYSVRFLDSVVTKNVFPFNELRNAANRTRKIGLGLMGIHDALLLLNIPYDSDQALHFVDNILELLNKYALEESCRIGKHDGVFPAFKHNVITDGHGNVSERKFAKLWNNHIMYNGVFTPRNASLTTIAPTGTISLLAGCSSGIEPVFSYVYKRKNVVGKEYMVIHPYFEQRVNDLYGDDKEKKEWLYNHMYEKGTIQDLRGELPDTFIDVFKTALDISPTWHIKMQACAQEWIMSSISKTINMPEDSTVEDVAEAIKLAYTLKCKGLTIYRTNSRKDAVLNLKEKTAQKGDQKEQQQAGGDIVVPYVRTTNTLEGRTYNIQSGCCKLYVTINHDEHNVIREVFVRNSGGTGGCVALLDALGRMVSMYMQNAETNDSIPSLIRSMNKTSCSACIRNGQAEAKSCSAAVAKCIAKEYEHIGGIYREDFIKSKLQDVIKNTEIVVRANGSYDVRPKQTQEQKEEKDVWVCPECGAKNHGVQGCKTCNECGYSKCG